MLCPAMSSAAADACTPPALSAHGRLALIHSSAASKTNNSVLAWVGDAALYLIAAEEVAGALGYVPVGTLR